jgi:hypothetical protein
VIMCLTKAEAMMVVWHGDSDGVIDKVAKDIDRPNLEAAVQNFEVW